MPNSNSSEADVLIVEPSRLYQQMIVHQLESYEVVAEIAVSAQEAIDKVKTNKFALVCCAYELPDCDGIQFTKDLRDHVGTTIPILLLTASDEKSIIKQALSNGVTEVILRNRLLEIQVYLKVLCRQSQWMENQKANVFYIEDSIPIARLTVKVLSDSGYQTDTVTRAEDSLKLIEEGKFDLLIVDMLLAGKMTGIGLIRHVRNLPEPICKLPILGVSGLDKTDQKIEALRQGATDFITKPVDYDELVVRVDNLVRSKKLYDKVLEQEKLLKEMAITDPLTQLYNRHYLADVGIKRVKEAHRHGHSLSLIVIDLDHFKLINDNYGHAAGDSVLRQVGQLLRRSCREEDFAVRFGGEEFVLVMPHCCPEDAAKKAEKIRNSIELLMPDDIKISASFGVSGISQEIGNWLSFNELFKNADKAVYIAKEEGRNQVRILE